MNNSGITRRIDELGRIVVPKEIRYNLGIRNGEPLDIYVNNNSIIIKKISQIENIESICLEYSDIISNIFEVSIVITDREKVIVTSKDLEFLINKELDDNCKNLIDNRESYEGSNLLNINKNEIAIPIITTMDSCGLIIVISDTVSREIKQKIAKLIQKLIVQKLDIAT